MKKLIYVLLASLFITAISCSKGTESKPPVVKPDDGQPADPEFTAADATAAYTAFNKYYYNPSKKLYYSTTSQDGLAAIWTQAIYWDMAMNVYERTKGPAQLAMVNDMYQGGFNQYDGYNWDNTTTWFIYDDMMWWVMALARANQLTGKPEYLQKAIAGFNRVWNRSYDSVKGGMFWDFQHSGKNACINYPTVIAAMRLYKITGDASYLDKAKSIYGWAKANLFDVNSGRVADHKIGDNPPGYEDYTYNQGTAIGAAVALYNETKDNAYLDDAKLAADYTKTKMGANGILPAEGDFNEQGVLKAIFAQYITQLITDGKQTQYLDWVKTNINTGWKNRDKARDLTWRNYALPAPRGVMQSYESSSIVTFMQLYLTAK
ncbi:glycoside hydrolase family 76 protein [Mucilaginibacter sp. AK015]|uniref:glycoside hydrolase family 76 protein n=1 Tax=Mucilaginibacter sp. AK015 TaxID=2723072 RepID=UPI00161C940D|nr:glycoside hydrolase family 76 protein [Mucilaginibacter sp. AK015]MBB5395294.1 putative alpha-1,6-mannanase (GH76 family) [Mucilaginibacter sp. AK015]